LTGSGLFYFGTNTASEIKTGPLNLSPSKAGDSMFPIRKPDGTRYRILNVFATQPFVPRERREPSAHVNFFAFFCTEPPGFFHSVLVNLHPFENLVRVRFEDSLIVEVFPIGGGHSRPPKLRTCKVGCDRVLFRGLRILNSGSRRGPSLWSGKKKAFAMREVTI
jgi:hypothetical protein